MTILNTKLFEEFPPITVEQWEQLVIKDLKGADYEKKLISTNLDEIKIKPYYTEKDLVENKLINVNPGVFPYIRGNVVNQSAENRQEVCVEDFSTAAVESQEIIKKGADSVEFIFGKNQKISQADFKVLLSQIDMTKNPVHLRAAKYSAEILDSFVEYCKKEYQFPEKIKGSLNFDFLGYQAISGQNPKQNGKEILENLKPVLEKCSKTIPNFKILTINGLIFREAGSSPVQELAFSFSSAVEYLHQATEAGIEPEKLIPRIAFSFGVRSDYFIEIAKIRAARVVWAKIVETYCPAQPEIAKMYVHTTTCNVNKTIYDPHVNILRTTTEAMSALLGGTDSLTIRPFDSIYYKPNEFSQHIARNISIILKEEAYFDKIVDVAGGAYFIENLTRKIIEKTWTLFLEIEQKGGLYEALKKEIIQNKINDLVQKQMMNIAMRRDILLGTNQYANPSEIVANNINTEIIDTNLFSDTETDFKPLKIFRGAAEFETLRLATEKQEKRPKVFLLTIGNAAMRKARASFAANFFACAGFEIIDNAGFENGQSGVNAALNHKAEITVVCSADDEYAATVPDIFKQINGKSIVVVAGYPTDCIEQFKSLGITNYIHIKSNIIDELKKYQHLCF